MSFLDKQRDGGGLVDYSGGVHAELKTKVLLFTIELGLGQDAPTDGESVFPIADMEGGDRRMMGHLTEEKHRKCKVMKKFQLIWKYSFHALANYMCKC